MFIIGGGCASQRKVHWVMASNVLLCEQSYHWCTSLGSSIRWRYRSLLWQTRFEPNKLLFLVTDLSHVGHSSHHAVQGTQRRRQVQFIVDTWNSFLTVPRSSLSTLVRGGFKDQFNCYLKWLETVTLTKDSSIQNMAMKREIRTETPKRPLPPWELFPSVKSALWKNGPSSFKINKCKQQAHTQITLDKTSEE